MSQVITAGSINSNATLAAGIIVIENLVPGTIQGIPTNIIGAAGTCTYGATDSITYVSTASDFSTQLGSVVDELYDLGTFFNAASLQGNVANYAFVRVTDGTDTMASTRLLDTAVLPVTGAILTAKYSGSTGNTFQAEVSAGVAVNTYNVSVGRPGYASELFSNISGTGNTFWQNLISAINNGQSGIRGPSNYVIASAGDGVSAATITNGGSLYTIPPVVGFSGGGGSDAAGTAVLGFAINSIGVILGGSYSAIPTVTTVGPGTGAVLTANVGALSGTYVASGSGYAPADTLTAVSGTFSSASTLTVATTRLVSVVLLAPGTGYVPGDIQTLIGGTFSTAAQVTCLTTQVVSATINTGGTGGTPGTQTVTGTTGTGTKFQASVTVSGGGVITAVLSITVGGSYTVNPTVLTNEPVTGAGLTGASLNVVTGNKTASITTPGAYTVNASSFTSSSSGVGTGATFNTALYGVNTVSVALAGSYSVIPTSPVSVTGGSGTGATFTILWKVVSVTVGSAGAGYTPSTTVAFSGVGGATASITLASTGSVIGITITDEGIGYTSAPNIGFTGGGGGSGAAATAIIGSTTAPSTVLNPYTFSGGTNGNSGVTADTLLGVNGALPTGMYVLANSNCSLFALVDDYDSDTYSDQDAFASTIGAQAIIVGEPGQTVAQGIAVKNAAGLLDNYAVFLLGDWCNWLDTNNGGITRMISPQGFYAGLMGNLSPEQSPLNKQILGILSTQKTLQNQVYSNQDQVNITQNGMDVITKPISRGNAFGCITGRSAGIEPSTNFVNIQRMANFLSFSFAGSALLAQYVGDLQTPSVQVSAYNSLQSFLKNLESSQMIQDSIVVLDSTNNPQSQVDLGIMQADVSVQLFSVVVVFLINLNVGTGSITSNIQSITPGVLSQS